MKNSRQFFARLKPRHIATVPTLAVSFNNKEDLRDIITDFILHNIESESKGINPQKFKSKRVKYPPIPLKVNVNSEEVELNFEFVTILKRYLEFEKKNIYRQERIEPLVVDILNFLDEVDEIIKGIKFQIDSTNKRRIEDEVLNLIIEKHHKDKQKRSQNLEIDEFRKNIIAKHTRISYIDIEDQLKKKEKEFLLEINEIDHKSSFSPNSEKKLVVANSISDFGDKLRVLIETGQIFENPDKIRELKKEKIIKFYNSNQIEYLNYEMEISQSMSKQKIPEDSMTENMKFLREWVTDINLSEKYYQHKFGRSEKKKMNAVDFQSEILGGGQF